MAVEVNGARRSHRLLKQQQEHPSQETKQGAASKVTKIAEDWEIAPGRIRTGAGDSVEDIAFSSPYLTQGRAVSVADNTTFQLVEVQPGSSLHWNADESRIRVCSVARGILKVKLLDKEFRIGPNGMWKVKRGVPCTVVNPFYLGAVLHVISIDENGC
ncbi:hypothetical protein MFIFM68171_03979 [Madurella fahalii]|uniref:Uncharacterized protein n=1 Tax=Madurella fahalii TaxID=1157608 RepID=A0ABQ0G7Y5_9PEZI